MTRFWFAASSEEFPPSQMLEQAKAAERAGFDGHASSDHFAPWFPDGQASSAWVTLGAIGQHTTGPIGTSVTPLVHHYHPGVVAQAFMSLEELYPGRAYLGTGSGEAVNEVPLGADWPGVGEQIERFGQAMEAITRLWDGETVTMDAGWFALKEAKLYTLAERKPRMYASAFGPQAAKVAAKHGDGLWTLGDPEQAPEIIEAYRSAGGQGEIIFQAGFHLGEPEDDVIARARKWKPTQFPEVYKDAIGTPEELQEVGRRMSDEDFAHEGFLVGADVDEHVARLQEMQDAGATVICLQLIGDHDPLESIRRYGEEVLPRLR